MSVLVLTPASKSRLQLASVVAVLFVVLFILATRLAEAWELSDFAVTFYRAGQYMIRGENVYLNSYPHPFNGREYPPYSPIWILYVFVPFTAFDLPTAQAFRFIMDVAFMPFLAYLSARWARLDARSVLLLAVAPWLLTEIHSGQLTPFVLLGVLLCYRGLTRADAALTAVGLWLALSKFTIVSLVIFATLVFAWRRRMLARTLTIFVVLAVFGSLASPGWLLDILQLYYDRLLHPRLADSALLLPAYPYAQVALLAIAAIAFVWYVWRTKRDAPGPWLWAVLLTASLVGALHTFIYDWQFLMLALALLCRWRAGRWFTVAVYAYSLVWTVLYAGLGLDIPTVKIIPGVVLVAALSAAVLVHLRAPKPASLEYA